MKQRFRVGGMSCAACSAHVEKSVSAVPGVSGVQVNLLAGSMAVEYDENACDAQTIIKAVESGGYTAAVDDGRQTSAPAQSPQADEALKEMKTRIIVSAIFMLVLMYFSMGEMVGLPLPSYAAGMDGMFNLALTELILALPIVIINRKYYINGFKTLLHRAPTMDALIAVGSGAALVYGIYALIQIALAPTPEAAHSFMHDLYFESAGMILTLVTLGKFFEARAKRKTGEAIAALMDLRPQTAEVIRGGQTMQLPIEQVQVGDLVIVRGGQSVPVDGEITEGSAYLDESAITGESMPVEKHVGDTVIGATVSKSGYVVMKASRVGDDTTLSQIIRLVEEAGGSKAPIAKLADKVSGVFVPVVITIALITIVVWLLLGQTFSFALASGIAVLVISCPCALGLATPTAIMVGTGRGAEQGILIKSGESLETAHLVDTVVLDKTGTITAGHPEVTDVVLADGRNIKELLKLAASLEQASEHPLAEAIVEKAEKERISLEKAVDFKAVEGQGVLGTVEGKTVLAGNLRMMQAQNIATAGLETKAEELADRGRTVLYIAADQQILGLLAVADTVKKTSAQAIREMQKMGLSVVMLTGDHEKTARAIQRELGIERVVAEVLPQDKEKEVRRLQAEGHKVAMVGDGINDAPALTAATVGCAIGSGSDIAIESADIVLMRSDLLDVAGAIELSKATIRNIKENLFWAFFYNIIGIPIAAGCWYTAFNLKMNPMVAALAMSFSSVFVVSNALRLRFFKPKHGSTVSDNTAETTTSVTTESPVQTISVKQTTIKQSNGGTTMKKELMIEGMMCQNCVKHVTHALEGISGASHVQVSLENKKATVEVPESVTDETLKAAVTEAGYEVTEIIPHEG